MSAPQFTAGPWSVGPPHVVAQRATDDKGRRTTRFVAEAVLSAPFVDGEREANANLIAQAPTMYEHLTVLVDVLSRLPATKSNDELWGAYTGAVAVTAKARGES